MSELRVRSGEDVASQALARQLAWAGGLGGLVVGAVVALLVIDGALDTLALSIVVGAVVGLFHLAMCLRLRAFVLGLADAREVTLEITAAPSAHLRRARRRNVARLGAAVFGRGFAAFMLVGADLMVFVCVVLFGMWWEGRIPVMQLLTSVGAISFLFITSCFEAARSGVLSAHAQLARAAQERHTIVQVTAARQAQGGELSTPAEVAAGELSMVHHQQRGGLVVHEARDEATARSAQHEPHDGEAGL